MLRLLRLALRAAFFLSFHHLGMLGSMTEEAAVEVSPCPPRDRDARDEEWLLLRRERSTW